MADNRNRFPLGALAIVAVLAATPHVVAQKAEPASESASESATEEKPAGSPGEDLPRSAAGYPLGAARVAPDGTILPDGDRPPAGIRARIRVDSRLRSRPVPTEAALPPAAELPSSPDGAADRIEGGTIGPGVSEQLEVFEPPRNVTGREVRDGTTWTPTAAYDDVDPARPYPWQPAEWGRAAIDPTWTPSPAWPRRAEGDAYPWNPVRWNPTGRATSWEPTDSWGRGSKK